MTIKEIAKISGVSIATVSRIINNDNSFRVSETTRERVIKNIREYGYIKRNIGSNINRFIIGLIKIFDEETESKNPYYSRFYQNLEDRLKKEKICYEILQKKRLIGNSSIDHVRYYDAIMIIGETSSKFVLRLSKYNKNIICLDNDLKIEGVDSVSFDYKLSVKKVINHLLNLGHRNIALITGKYDKKDFRARYFDEIIRKKKKLKKTTLMIGELKKKSGYLLTKELLKKRVPTAIFCGNNSIAMGVYEAIHESGRYIPDDISVIGFNDEKNLSVLNPPLTTISIDIENIIDIGIKLLKERIYDNRTFSCKVLVHTNLEIRKSIKKIGSIRDKL